MTIGQLIIGSRPSRRTALIGGAALVAGSAFFAVPRLFSPAETASQLTADAAHQAAASGDVLLIDIRRPDEWARTGVPEHAVPIDMRDSDFLAQLRAARLSPDQPVAVICARGVRSARMTQRLESAGIQPIIDIPEGMLGSRAGPGWLARGLPVYPM